MMCNLCRKKHAGRGSLCAVCKRMQKIAKKIPKGQRKQLQKFIKESRVSVRRLLA